MLGANKSHKVNYIPADGEWYSYMIIAGLLSKKSSFCFPWLLQWPYRERRRKVQFHLRKGFLISPVVSYYILSLERHAAVLGLG